MEAHSDIARRFQITPGLVSWLSLRARRDPKFLTDLQEKRDAKRRGQEAVQTVVQAMC
jgi:hypothetical protein